MIASALHHSTRHVPSKHRWLCHACALVLPVVCLLSATRAEAQKNPHAEQPPLIVNIDKKLVDLTNHQLVVEMSRPAGHVEIKVFGESGLLLAEENHDFQGKPAHAPLLVKWSPKTPESVGKIELYAFDAKDYYKGIALIPWSFSVPHEEVVFKTNSAQIVQAEEPKLEASLKLIQKAIQAHKELGHITLFIAGHTDTQGTPQHNLQLSRRRARAIALWFRKHGLTTPVAYVGFGERVPKVKTADEVDEPKNRRVDYVLSVEMPRYKHKGGAPAWQQLP